MKISSRAVRTLAALIVIALTAGISFSQTASQSQRPTPTPPRVDGTRNPDDPPLTTFEEEIRAKREIKMAEKDHQQNLDRAHEIAEIGKQLKESISGKSTFDRGEYLKKIERLEKLTKKIRGEAGGEDQDVSIPKQPTDLSSAVTEIAEAADALSKDVEKTPRRVVSASVICNANVLLELIRVARTFAGPQP